VRPLASQTMGALTAAFLCALATNAAVAQDPTKVDANHYKVTFENEEVRIRKITIGPKEKSGLHDCPTANLRKSAQRQANCSGSRPQASARERGR